MGGVNACLTFTFPIKQNQDINTSILKTVQTLQCLIQNTGQNLDLDVSLAHPWSQDIIRRASKEICHAALTKEEKKMKKYSEELVPGGYVSRCVPLVIPYSPVITPWAYRNTFFWAYTRARALFWS